MKTLILYATKYGATREIAGRIAKRMEGAVVFDLGSGNAPTPDPYDCVLIGSSVYAGRLRKEAKEYAAQHAEALKSKRLGLFVSGMAPEGTEVSLYLDANYPKDVVAYVKAAAMLGGVSDPKKENPLERLMMRVITKTSDYANTISDEKIDRFVEAVKA